MMKKLIFLFLFIIPSIHSWSQLGGSYTIGGVLPDYTSITNAINDLISQGVNSPTTFNIRPGNYDEQFIIPEINGASPTNTITLQSELQDSSSVFLEWNGSSSSDNYIILLDGADYININNLSLTRSSGAFAGRLITIQNGSSFNFIENIHFFGNYGTNSNSTLVMSLTELDTNNVFQFCTFENGYRGLHLYSYILSSHGKNNIIKSNVFHGMYNGGIVIDHQANFLIESNIFENLGNCFPIALYDCNNGGTINKNHVKILPWANRIYISDCYNTSVNPIIFSNNIIDIKNGPIAITGINSENIYFYNNTFKSDFFVSNILDFNNCNVNLKNNIIAALGGGNAIKSINSILNSNNNVLYSSGQYIADYNSISIPNLSNWTLQSGQDSSSYETLPGFIANDNLHIRSDINLNQTGVPLGITTDFDGELRDINHDIGADEFTLAEVDAGITDITSPLSLICADSLAVSINLRNMGSNSLDSVIINWSINDSILSSFYWSGNLISGDTAKDVVIGYFNFMQDTTYQIKSWTSFPNGITDTIPHNDTIVSDTILTRMKGSYFIGDSNSHYSSFNESIDDLLKREICGEVVFNVRPGIYAEMLFIPQITGASDSSWVIWQSEYLDNSSVVLKKTNYGYGGPNAYTMHIDQSSYLKFKDLTITKDNNTGTVEWFVYLLNSHDLIFENNYFPGGQLLDVDPFRITWCSDLMFKMNTFRNCVTAIEGHYNTNVTFYGNNFDQTAGTSIVLNTTNTLIIDSNTFFNDYFVYPNNAIGVGGVTGEFSISKNRFYGYLGKGMALYNMFFDSTQRGRIVNNFISINRFDATGIYIEEATYLDILHNNVYIQNDIMDSSIAGIAHSALTIRDGEHFRIANNNFWSEGIYIYDLSTSPTYFDLFSNNNNYTTNTQTQLNGYTFYGNLNADSLSVDPDYISNTDLHIQNQTLLSSGIDLGIFYDIDNDIRHSLPTIGADEKDSIFIDVSPVFISSYTYNCDSSIFYINITNNGFDTIFNFTLNWSINGSIPKDSTFFDTIIPDLQSTYYLDYFQSLPDSLYLLNVWTTLPNMTLDEEVLNDSISWLYSFPNSNTYITLQGNNPTCENTPLFLNSNYTNGNTWYLNGISFDTSDDILTSSSGSYILQHVSSEGCASVDSALITHYPNTSSSISEATCLFYQAPSGQLYTSSGTYLDTISNSIGCDSIITINLTVTTIDTSITHTWGTFESNDINATYQWINCDSSSTLLGETNQSFTPTLNGNYAVQLTDNGCIDTSSCYLINSVGLLESTFESNLIVYPNPTNGLLKIELGESYKNISIQVIDVDGKIVLNKQFGNRNTFNMDLTAFANGVYLVKLKADDKEAVLRVVKEE